MRLSLKNCSLVQAHTYKYLVYGECVIHKNVSVCLVFFLSLIHLKLAHAYSLRHSCSLVHPFARSFTFASHNGTGLIVQKCFGDKWRWRNVCVHEKGLSHIIHRAIHFTHKIQPITLFAGKINWSNNTFDALHSFISQTVFLLRADFLFCLPIHPKWKMVLFQKRFALKLSDPQPSSENISCETILRRLLKIGA